MKQNQKQYVNVIINQDKPKRRKHRTKKQPTNENNILKDNKPNPSNVAYNPNTLSTTRVPSYGLASINPTLTEHPLLSNISDAVKNFTPKIEDYKNAIQDDLQKNIQDQVGNTMNNMIEDILSTRGSQYLDNYFTRNSTALSRANTYEPSVFTRVEEEEKEEEEEPIQPREHRTPTLSIKNQPVRLKFIRGRPKKGGRTDTELIQYNIDLTKQELNDLTNQTPEQQRTLRNRKKIKELSKKLETLFQAKEDETLRNELIQNIKPPNLKKGD